MKKLEQIYRLAKASPSQRIVIASKVAHLANTMPYSVAEVTQVATLLAPLGVRAITDKMEPWLYACLSHMRGPVTATRLEMAAYELQERGADMRGRRASSPWFNFDAAS